MADVPDKPTSQLYAVKVTNGQEKTVAEMLADKAKIEHISVLAILAPSELKGYIIRLIAVVVQPMSA